LVVVPTVVGGGCGEVWDFVLVVGGAGEVSAGGGEVT
jgi:hypothetical protein